MGNTTGYASFDFGIPIFESIYLHLAKDTIETRDIDEVLVKRWSIPRKQDLQIEQRWSTKIYHS